MKKSNRQLICYTQGEYFQVILSASQSADDWIDCIKRAGGVWAGGVFFPWHSITQINFRENK
jgi:hypothetical protein